MLFKILVTFSFLCILILSRGGWAEEGKWLDPWEEERLRPNSEKKGPDTFSLGQVLTIGLLRFYQKNISPLNADKCPSYPSCSHYALEAVKKHGALMGLILTFDRLIHEADEVHRAPLVNINGQARYYDPLENNDFWWYKK